MLDFDSPAVMGILNVTPDSFSDGGKFNSINSALRRVEEMISQGADIIDVGGESTRPQSFPVPVDEELQRTIPIIKEIVKNFSIPISIDTSSPEVMLQAVDAGATFINDVRALTEPDALETAVKLDVPICLMHMQGTPKTMQISPSYRDVTQDVVKYLADRVKTCLKAGMLSKNIILDPGFGFGKSLKDNLVLLQNINSLKSLGYPILVGLSRKSMFKELLGLDVNERLNCSVAANLIAYANGGNIFRVHDVAATVEALTVAKAVGKQ